MIGANPAYRPIGAALAQRIRAAMEVILHIGAHRCATTSFQHYLRKNTDSLTRQGIGAWGPFRTRNGLFRGILPGPVAANGRDQHRRAIGRVRMNLGRSAALGLRWMVVSDENMLGSIRENLRFGELYSGAGERLARFHQAFGGQVTDIVLNIRAPNTYWASALAFSLTRGRDLPSAAALSRLSTSPRSWRDVVTDVACAMPGARLWVTPFERFAGRPEAQLAALTGGSLPLTHARDWLNAAPRLPELRGLPCGQRLPQGEGRWQPFSPAQQAEMQDSYADDLMWLTGGADGLARIIPDKTRKTVGLNPPETDLTRGRRYGDEERRMARAR